MAGPSISVDYTDDTGATFPLRIPQWHATLNGVSAGSSTNRTPKGFRPRVRYVQITATGKEKKVTCPDTTATFWTAAMGAAVTVPLFNAALAGSANATSRGRTGERYRDIE